MSFEKKMKERGNNKIDAYADNPYYQGKTSFIKKMPLWAKISIPSSLVTVGVVLAVVLSIPSSGGSVSVIPTSYISHRINNPVKEKNKEHQYISKNYVSSVNDFGESFYNIASNKLKDDNLIFSPLSIATCLAMVYDGATDETKAELAAALNIDETKFDHLKDIQRMMNNYSLDFKTIDDKKLISDVSEGFFVDDEYKNVINKDYLDLLEKNYYAEAFEGELKSDEMHQALADFINNKTNNFFDLSKEDFKTLEGIMWLINTIYFKSNWAIDFVQTNKQKTFNNLNGSVSNNVSYIASSYKGTVYEDDEFYIVSADLLKGFKFNILLPKEGTDYKSVLDNSVTKFITRKEIRESYNAEIWLTMPEFKARTKYILAKDGYLKELGISRATDMFLAEFFNVIPKEANKGNVFVSEAIHEAGIDVNVDGVEAAAYTVVSYDAASSAPLEKIVELNVNHPFLYSITSEDDNLVMFLGKTNSL